MKYVNARIAVFNDDLLYKAYISDSLNLSTQGKRLSQRFIDILRPQVQPSGDEIVMDVMRKGHLKFEGQ